MNDSSASNNLLLYAFLRGRDESASADALIELVNARIEPIVKAVIRGKLHVFPRPDDERQVNQDAYDLVSSVKTLLLGRLTKLKSENWAGTIDNLEAYVKTVTINACNHHLRNKYPNRLRLKNQVRYLLTHNTRFSLWTTKDESWFCGFSEWVGCPVLQASKQEKHLTEQIQQVFEKEDILADSMDLVDLVSAIFECSQQPIRFGELIAAVYELKRITEPVEVVEDEADAAGSLGAEGDLLNRMEQAAFLKALWDEIGLLPLRHRAALLLNLKNTQGEGLITLLPMTRTANLRQIADCLEFPVDEFAKIWNDLPWDDLAIAEHLGLTRQQVINLRQSARATLRCRLKYF